MRSYVAFVVALAAAALIEPALGQEPNLIPMPVSYERRDGSLSVDTRLAIEIAGLLDDSLSAVAGDLRSRLGKRIGRELAVASPKRIRLEIPLPVVGAAKPKDGDESYELTITAQGGLLRAPTVAGIMRGVETILQLLEPTPSGWVLPAGVIRDRPRFAWRGLMLDVARHFLPLADVVRVIDGMALVKLNVLHLHLTDDQGFRVESLRYPKLHEMGSGGAYYKQSEIRQIVNYARRRGIRVVPEFDMPGHTTSWLAGYPELASRPGTYQPETGFGVFDAALNPTSEAVYEFLDGLIGEMVELFPDAYFHLGGDEVNGKHWESNPHIRAFRLKQRWKSHHDLQAYFVQRVAAIVEKHGKKPIAWDEVLSPGLPASVSIQAWRGQRSIVAAADAGRETVVSTGFYLDWMLPAEFHYRRDPAAPNESWNDRYDELLGNLVPVRKDRGLSLSAEQASRIVGGEAALWSEFITPLNLDIRLWPRLAAIAERFWSPADRRDVQSLYRRLELFGLILEREGIPHQTRYLQHLRRLAGEADVDPLVTLAGLLEPPPYVARILSKRYTTASPLDRLADVIRPESLIARQFAQAVDVYLRTGEGESKLRETLELWKKNHDHMAPALKRAELAEAAPVSRELAEVARVGLEALDMLQAKRRPPGIWVSSATTLMNSAAEAKRELRIAVAPAVLRLVQAAAR